VKDIYFLGGLPRSGNTLLSAILNQNPEVYVSPPSPLLDNLYNIDKMLSNNEPTQIVDFEEQTTSGLKEFVNGFYKNIHKPIVLDRNKMWGGKESIFLAHKYITNTPKIIFTVRDIPSILTSFLSLIGDNQDNYIDDNVRNMGLKPYGEQTQNDLRCDWLMNTQMALTLTALTELLQLKVPVCLIEYDDLVMNPQTELNRIYDFLNLETFNHDFENIIKLESENLINARLPVNLHDVRCKVEKISLDYKSVLPLHTQKKYSGLEFWRQ
jgi:sulfotransferase